MQFLKSFDSENIGYLVINQPKDSYENIIVIPGFGGDINFLNNFLDELKLLKPQAAIYFFNPRGHGFSSKNFPEGDMLIEDIHANDFFAFIKHLGLKKFIVIGHSYGGVIFQNYLNLTGAQAPQKFFLVCSTIKVAGFSRLKKMSYKILCRLSDNKKPFFYQTSNFYKKLEHSQDINFERWLHDTRITGGIINWFLHFLSIGHWQNNDLTTLNRETGYYVYGKKDIIIPKATQMRYLKKLNKVNPIEVDTGHLAPITNPKELAKIISSHI